MSRGRRTRPFYKVRVAILSLAILPIACFIGLEILLLTKAMAKGSLPDETLYGAIILGCIGAIFLLIWLILLQGKTKYRSRSTK